ncbi:unnamed protein product, partial [Allacma fusca]
NECSRPGVPQQRRSSDVRTMWSKILRL